LFSPPLGRTHYSSRAAEAAARNSKEETYAERRIAFMPDASIDGGRQASSMIDAVE
jgi:hypothetical protein